MDLTSAITQLISADWTPNTNAEPNPLLPKKHAVQRGVWVGLETGRWAGPGAAGWAGMVWEGVTGRGLLGGGGSPSSAESSAGVRFREGCLGRVILVPNRWNRGLLPLILLFTCIM